MQKNIKYSIISLLPFLFFIFGYILSHLFVGGKSHPAPHVIGMTLHEALRLTSQNHVTLQLVAEKECSDTAPGTILTQKPASGRMMKQNQTMLVTVCKQPEVNSTPNLLSKTTAQIEEIVKEKSLKVKTFMQNSSKPSGTCIGQSPQPNLPLYGNKMIIYISCPRSNSYIMPSFTGHRLTEVLHALLPHQIIPTVLLDGQKLTDLQDENLMVIDQKPKAGSFVTLNEKLNVQLEVAEKEG